MGLKCFLLWFHICFLTLLVLGSASDYHANASPTRYTPSSPTYETPSYTPTYDGNYYNGRKILPTIYGVQGVVYCSSCHGYKPIEGAEAKISCKSDNKYGYKTTMFSMLSPKTDKYGYFLATINPEQLDSLKPINNCKVHLESSSSYNCNVATNINLGKTGARVTYTRIFDSYKNTYNLILYSAPTFVYASNDKCERPIYHKATPITYTP